MLQRTELLNEEITRPPSLPTGEGASRGQNLNSDFTDSALGSSEKSPLPYGNFQLRESTVQSILNHPRYGPKFLRNAKSFYFGFFKISDTQKNVRIRMFERQLLLGLAASNPLTVDASVQSAFLLLFERGRVTGNIFALRGAEMVVIISIINYQRIKFLKMVLLPLVLIELGEFFFFCRRTALGSNMYTYLKFGLPRVFPPKGGAKETSSGYNSSDEGCGGGGRPPRSGGLRGHHHLGHHPGAYMRAAQSEADILNLHYQPVSTITYYRVFNETHTYCT
ncbi:hypothetical protein AAG570_005197 [Ranatra chinensis]|uniref:Uncharacterized protein n=1 Tax=Ranatra chinensis TaxID=642074 RepID=A0ABD0Y290_9HEMI